MEDEEDEEEEEEGEEEDVSGEEEVSAWGGWGYHLPDSLLLGASESVPLNASVTSLSQLGGPGWGYGSISGPFIGLV